jgi:hypothetical protein
MSSVVLNGVLAHANTDAAALSRDGATVYRLFKVSFRLSVVLRQAGDEHQFFRTLLTNVSTGGGLTIDDWRLLQTRDHSRLSSHERESFKDTQCLYTTCEQAHKHNLDELVALNVPCARILAKHDVTAKASKASVDMAAGLQAVLVLGKGAPVMITRNLWQGKGASKHSHRQNITLLAFQGIVDATVGTVEDILWDRGVGTGEEARWQILAVAIRGHGP